MYKRQDIKGLVTLEDILEEIVGDFTTSMAPSIEQEVVHQSDGSMIIEGSEMCIRDSAASVMVATVAVRRETKPKLTKMNDSAATENTSKKPSTHR